MALMRLNIKVEEAINLLNTFSINRTKALCKLTNEITTSVSKLINELLNEEIEIFLENKALQGNKRNGYHPSREYALKGLGSIKIRIPKDRKGKFESVVIPKYERSDPRLKADMAMLHLAGLSTRTLSMISKRLLGLSVSKDLVSESLDLIKTEASKWLERPINKRYWGLFIDGTNFQIQRQGSSEKESSLIIIGIDENNYKSVVAIESGCKDDAESWRILFKNIKARGLDGQYVKIGVMDGLPGLERAFQEEFPKAVTARCWIHASKNILVKVPERFRELFKKQLDKIMYASSLEEAKNALKVLTTTFSKSCERAVNCLEKDIESLLTHYTFEKTFWFALKTTNVIERLHKEFKRRTRSMESLGEYSLMAILAFVALRVELGWRFHPLGSQALDNLKRNRKEDKNVLEKIIDEMNLVQ